MNLQWIKKNKKKCFIQDGIIKYTLSLTPFPKCICMKNDQFCKHLQYYFSEIIKLEKWKINMLDIHEIKEKITTTNLNYSQVTELCYQYLKENDCGICLEAFGDYFGDVLMFVFVVNLGVPGLARIIRQWFRGPREGI